MLTNAQTLSQCFREKFVSIPAAAESPDHLITFYIEDKDYGVSHQLDSADEIYDGAIIEVHTQNEDGGSGTISPFELTQRPRG